MNAQLQQMLANLQGGGAQRAVDAPLPDTAETVYISSLSLLKMLKHGELHPQGPSCDVAYLMCRPCWRPDGGDGPDAGGIRRRVRASLYHTG